MFKCDFINAISFAQEYLDNIGGDDLPLPQVIKNLGVLWDDDIHDFIEYMDYKQYFAMLDDCSITVSPAGQVFMLYMAMKHNLCM